jgi:type II secretory pathway pseudopilin PulG
MHRYSVNISTMHTRGILGQRGISLLEVLFATVIIGIIVVGFVATLGTAVTTTERVTDTNALAAHAFREMEELRSVEFGLIPFSQTSQASALKEVPNYFYNILPELETAVIISTGDSLGYPLDAGADGLRADDTTLKWVGDYNLLTDGVSEGPDASGPGDDDPGGSGGDDGPSGGGPGNYPDGYQFWMIDLGQQYKMSRVLYDNRFNVHEAFGVGLDSNIHRDDVWQNQWRFFFRETELAIGEVFDPRYHGETLTRHWGGAYGSSGVNLIYDDWENPLYAAVLGVTEIDTYSDFDPDFHWPYVSEVEVYGFDKATEYYSSYTDSDGVTSYNNVIMYFENYKNQGIDLARRCYVPAEAMNFDPIASLDLIRVQVEFYPYQRSRNTEEWMRKTWLEDGGELTRYLTSFYRDGTVRRDNLPLLTDLPEHAIYGDNEDFTLAYTVPGATEVRFFFSVFDLQADPSSDYIEFFDSSGMQYGELAYYGRPGDPYNLENGFGPWVAGDTIVIHFHSDPLFNSAPPDYLRGFKVSRVEMRKPGYMY